MSQRYPEEYDGIVAVVPAFNRLGLHTCFLWIDRVMRESGVRFTKEDIANTTAHAADFAKRTGCSKEDHRFVSRPRTDDTFIRSFVGELRGVLPHLTEAHRTALRKIYEAPQSPHGRTDLRRHARLFLVPGQDNGAQITRYAPARMNGDVESKTAVDVICAWCKRGIAPERFDMITEADGAAVEKTIFAYGTKENPLPPAI